jgi:glycosyltransferase involved in cell wall biosynthesis
MNSKNLNPLVSICIPTYNGSSYIEETLECVINQTYSNIEIIITDDNSTDDTALICKRYAEKDQRIKFYQNEINLGLIGNWKKSIEKSTSSWIKFLFQDDLFELNCVEEMITVALSNKVNFVLSNRAYIFDDNIADSIKKSYDKLPQTGDIFSNSKVYTPNETSGLISKTIFHNSIGEPPTYLFNKEKYSPDDFPDDFQQLIDYMFALNKILSENFYFLNKKLVKFRVHNNSQTAKNTKVGFDNLKELNKHIQVYYYERLKICYELLHNSSFTKIKEIIGESDIIKLKKFITYKSLKRLPVNDVKSYYATTPIDSFILDGIRKPYNLNYKIIKSRLKKQRKFYKL